MTSNERNAIVERNLGLVHRTVNALAPPKYMREDAEQVGYVALIKAVEGHDPKRGALSTYATHAIKNAILKYVGRYAGVVSRPTRHLNVPMENVYTGVRG